MTDTIVDGVADKAADGKPNEKPNEKPADATDEAAAGVEEGWSGAFRVVLKPRTGGQDDTVVKEIEFRPVGTPTPDQLQLYTSLTDTLAVLRSIFTAVHEIGKHNGYVVRLSRIADVGLERGFASVASIELNAFRDSLLALEAPRIKNAYMFRLGMWALAMAMLAALMIAIFRVEGMREALGANEWHHTAAIFGYLWIGAMAGCWLSFGVRNPQLSFEALGQPDKELLKPPLRLLFTGLLSVTLGLTFVTGVVGVKIGTFSTDVLATAAINGQVTTNEAALALLIGLFCGIGEQALSASVGQRANQFIGEASK